MRRRLSKKRAFKIFAAVAFSAGLPQGRADTPASWANPSGNGNWSDPTKWSPAVSPNGAYSVTLPAGDETVTLDVSRTIDSLTIDAGAVLETNATTSLTTASINNSGAVYFSQSLLTVNGATTNSSSFNIGELSTASFTGAVVNNGTFIIGEGDGEDLVNVSGTFTNTNSLYVNAAGDVANFNALNNQNLVVVNANATLNITGGGQGVTDLPAGAEYDIDNKASFNVINGGVSTGALVHLSTVEGRLYLLSGETYALGSLTNSGSFNIGEGTTVSFAGNVTNSNAFSTGYNGGGNLVNVSGTFTNINSLSLNSAGDIVNVNALNNENLVVMNAGTTLNITGGGQGVTDVPAGAEYDIYSNANFNVINGGVSTGALVRLSTVEGRLYLLSGGTFGFGSVTNSGGFNVGEGTTVSFTGNVTNSNSFVTGYNGGNNVVNVSGTLTNLNTFTLNSLGDAANIHALNNQDLVVLNAGTALNITGGGQGITDVPAGVEYDIYNKAGFNVINSGVSTGALVHLSTVEGRLYLLSGETYGFGPLTNSGSFFVGEGTTVSFAGNVTNSNGFTTGYGGGNNVVNVSGTFINTAAGSLTLDASGDIVNVNALNNQGDVDISAGTTLNITGGGLGITVVIAGSEIDIFGNANFNVINGGVTTGALAHLASVEGRLYLVSGETYQFGSPTNSGSFNVGEGTSVSFSGNVTNSGGFNTGYGGGNNLVNVSGTFTNTAAGSLSLGGSGDVANVNSMNNKGSISINPGATLNITGGNAIVNGNANAVNVSGTFTNTGTLSTGGTMAVYNTGRVNINGGSVSVGAVSLSDNGVVNVNGTLNINYSSPANDPVATIVGYLKNGSNGGAWNGTSGLVSTSVTPGSPATSLGYVDGNTDAGTVAGPNQIVVKYTLLGDTNLDGLVNFGDLVAVLQNFNKGGTDWAHGNFAFGASTNFGDLVSVLQNFNKTLPPPTGTSVELGGGSTPLTAGTTIPFGQSAGAQVSPTLVVLPEPGTGALILSATALLARRRRRAKSAPRIAG